MACALTRQRTKAEAPRSAETNLARAHASARERLSLSCATSRLELITEVVTSWIVEASCWISAEKSAMLCLVCFASAAASASFSDTLRSYTNTQHAKGTQASQKRRSASPQPQQSRRLRSCFVGGGCIPAISSRAVRVYRSNPRPSPMRQLQSRPCGIRLYLGQQNAEMSAGQGRTTANYNAGVK